MTYTSRGSLLPNHFALVGTWNLQPENATPVGGSGAVQLAFNSGKVFIVASSAQPLTLDGAVDGRKQPPVTVQESRLYTLFDSNDYKPHIMTVAVPKAGLEAFSFTFG